MTIHYHPVRRLGSGGFGDIVLARRSDTDALVVLKFLRDPHLDDNRRAFLREVRILGRRLKGLVTLLDANTEAERPFYVMPYLPGGSLDAWAGRLSAAQLLAVALDLGAAVWRLHAAFISHGDIKPANILLADDGRLRVADPLGNGIGCTVLFAANRGGTPGYWAPEVRGGGEISSAGDVYSFGATLYHLATGQRPEDRTRLDVLASRLDLPPAVQEAIMACCHPSPPARPSIRDVLRMLHGECWSDIKEARSTFWTSVLVGGTVLGAIALFGKEAR